MAGEWRKVSVGAFAPFAYGKGLPEHRRDSSGQVPAFGSNGVVGFHCEALTSGPTVVIGRKGTVGAVHYSPKPCWPIDTTFYVVDPDPCVLRFKYYLLKALGLEHMNADSAVPGLNRDAAHSREVLVPPLPEQRAIAHILGTLDDKIELNRRMSQILEEIARAVFREMIKDVKEEESILEFAELLSGGTPSTAEEGYWNGDIEWVSAKDVSNADGVFLLDTEKKITQAGIDHSSTKLLPAKTTIVTARGTVGAHCMLGKPMTMNQTNYGLKAKEGIGDYFVYFALSEMIDQLKQQSYGTIFDTITTKTFYSLLCPRPSLDVIQQFEERVAPLMDTILNNQQQSRTLAALRDALLPKLIRGEIRVKDAEKFLQERGL